MHWTFGGAGGHDPSMSRVLRARHVRWAAAVGAAVLLLAPGCAAHALDAASARAPRATAEVRELALAGGTVRVQVNGTTDAARTQELHRWIEECLRAALAAYGRLPLARAQVRIEQSASTARSPVPWGQTSRRGDVAVLLYVREDATFDELRADWTAVHELAHLFHPYLGSEGRWLAEGLASYYQNVLRARAGLLARDDAWRRLEAGFGRGRREASGAPLRELSREHRGTMRVYWAGAAFWLEADLALRHGRDTTLDAVLSQYARCCLRGTGEVAPREFLDDLDRIAGGDTFASLHARYVDSTTFPPLEDAYAALGLEPRAGALQLSTHPKAVALREAIMGRRPPP